MSSNTNTQTPNPDNPSSLKPCYEIYRLSFEHAKWASAIIAHSMVFNLTMYASLYPTNMTNRAHELMGTANDIIMNQISGSLSFGAFDTGYEYKTEDAQKAGGMLYRDLTELSVQKDEGSAAKRRACWSKWTSHS
jgi:hypothetical protein